VCRVTEVDLYEQKNWKVMEAMLHSVRQMVSLGLWGQSGYLIEEVAVIRSRAGAEHSCLISKC
jgi:hypothetical protein